jgi:pimeloyl-ACP methyl ester carboxylesterase
MIAGPLATAEVTRELLDSMSAIPAATYRDALWCFTHPEEKMDFSRIACPVLLMTGEHDRLASPHEIRNVAQRVREASPKPDVSFEVIPGAGHLCNIENPQAFNHQLLRFLRRFAV